MKISFSTLGCPKMGLKEIFAVAGDLGYSGVEIRGVGSVLEAPDLPQFGADRCGETINELEKRALTIPLLTSACVMHSRRRREASMSLACRYIDTASALGAGYIRVLGDSTPEPKGEVDDAFVAANLAELAEYAAPKKVGVLIETNGVYASSARLAALIEMAGVKNIGALWDIHHTCRFFGEQPEETLKNIGGYIRHVHIKDSVAEGEGYAYRMTGHGDIPLEGAIAGLIAADYDGFYSLEWVKRWNTELEEPGIAFAQYVRFMKRMSRKYE